MRNPFRIRASQRSVSDEEFVKLFGAGVFDLLDNVDDPWSGLVFLRSAPGGGKTTFLRLMTPRPLQLTSRLLESSPQVRATWDALRNKGAIGDGGPQLLGAMVIFTTEYRDLAEFDRGNSLFRALLNSRIVIATLRAVLERAEKTYPDDLAKIRFEWSPESGATIPAKASGQELFEWASEIERGFYDRMDDLGAPAPATGGHARLDGLKWFSQAQIFDQNGPVDVKRILLLDELQTLASVQRESLTDILVQAREACGIWIAERLEALNHRDLLSEGALEERDYQGVIQLERRWAGNRARAYARFVEQIATLRASKADGFEGRDFFSFIGERDDLEAYESKFVGACEAIETKLQSRKDKGRYEVWLSDARELPGTAIDRAIRWRTTEILIEGDARRAQTSFDFAALTQEEFSKREKRVEKASEHFVRTEIGVPLYFGRETLSAVSSCNVDQYLEVAGELFEEISAKFKGRRDNPAPLSPQRQDSLIRKVAASRWDGLARRIPQGYDARRLLDGLGEFCREQTFRPTAPYAPGVTGFGITMADRKLLIDSPDEKIKSLIPLRDVLTSLVAHNILVPRIDHQNNGKRLVVFYLNRLLCVHFGLPLGFGGWREKSMIELFGWLQNGPSRTAAEEATLV